MLLVITGKVKSGKTGFLMEIVERLKGMKIVGIVAPTVLRNGKIEGYEAILLPEGEKLQHVALQGEGERVGRRYVLLKDAKKRIEKKFEGKDEADLYIFDEYGPLELSGKGLIKVFNNFRETGKDMVVVVRESILNDFLGIIGNQDVRVVKVGEADPSEIARIIKATRRF